MNKLKYLLSAFVLLCFASCKDDPWEDVADGGWNHERSIIDVKFEGQAGTPTITETDSETGVIELQLASDMVADMSKVRVETLTLSYKATANVASGGTIDFTNSAQERYDARSGTSPRKARHTGYIHQAKHARQNGHTGSIPYLPYLLTIKHHRRSHDHASH